MKHCEPLRSTPILYTRVQFALVYCQVHSKWYGETDFDIEKDSSVEKFRDAIRGANDDESSIENEAE